MPISDFTYRAYADLISLIRKNGYQFIDYGSAASEQRRVCILRHDIDFDLDKALALARLERELSVKSTYFVLLRTDFYNPFSAASKEKLDEIRSLGHDIGLHFDEQRYTDDIDIPSAIKREADILGNMLNKRIGAVSMHRPSKRTLAADYAIDGIVNSYSKLYFEKFKYLSDSRRRWRENAEHLISSGEYERLHILTHAFWYNEFESDTRAALLNFLNDAKRNRYIMMRNNFTDLGEFIGEADK